MKIAKQLFLLVCLAEIAWIDQQKRRISNGKLGKLLCARGIFLLLNACICPESLKAELALTIWGFVFPGMFFFCFYFISKKRIGAGDVKLLAVLGAFCGVEQGLLAAFFAAVYAVLAEVIHIRTKKINFKKELPFAPFVFWGTLTVLFWEVSGITW